MRISTISFIVSTELSDLDATYFLILDDVI